MHNSSFTEEDLTEDFQNQERAQNETKQHYFRVHDCIEMYNKK